MTGAQIIGWGHTAFGKSDLPDTESLMALAVAQALEHAQIGAEDVDGRCALRPHPRHPV